MPLLQPDPKDRSPPPEGVWDLNAYLSWRDAVWTLMGDVLDDRVRREFRRRPPKYVVSDDLDWLDSIIERVTGRYPDIKTLTAERLSRRYERLRACHATRTEDPALYYSQGLLPLDTKRAQARAAKIFLTGDYPELTAADLDRAIATVGSDLRGGRIYFEANEQGLISDSGHYLLYGGEYLIALAANLGQARDYRQALKAFGRPTMFICDVPLTLIGSDTLEEFAGGALEAMFENLLDEGYEPDPHGGAGFCIRRPLTANRIVGHYHPSGIRDPFRGFRYQR